MTAFRLSGKAHQDIIDIYRIRAGICERRCGSAGSLTGSAAGGTVAAGKPSAHESLNACVG
jgi:hypothetical protein